jgi:hypothetical protein
MGGGSAQGYLLRAKALSAPQKLVAEKSRGLYDCRRGFLTRPESTETTDLTDFARNKIKRGTQAS